MRCRAIPDARSCVAPPIGDGWPANRCNGRSRAACVSSQIVVGRKVDIAARFPGQRMQVTNRAAERREESERLSAFYEKREREAEKRREAELREAREAHRREHGY